MKIVDIKTLKVIALIFNGNVVVRGLRQSIAQLKALWAGPLWAAYFNVCNGLDTVGWRKPLLKSTQEGYYIPTMELKALGK